MPMNAVMNNPPLEISVSYAISRTGVPATVSFRRWVLAALGAHPHAASVGIRLVGSEEGRALNRDYRGRDYPTNVLSFPAERPPGLPETIPFPELGDLILCAPVIAREAREQNKSLNAHYAHLTIHGILHLLGWDHETDQDAEAMEQRECGILAALGIANPY